MANQSCRYYCTKASGICKTVGLFFSLLLQGKGSSYISGMGLFCWVFFKYQHAQEFHIFMFQEYHPTPNVNLQSLVRTTGLHCSSELLIAQWWICMKTKIKGNKKHKEIKGQFTSGSPAEQIFSFFAFLLSSYWWCGNIYYYGTILFASASLQAGKIYTTSRRK